MGGIIGLALLVSACVTGVAVLLGKASRSRDKKPGNSPAVQTMRCPSCGSPATVHGNSWECGWCGDFGSLR